MPIRSQRRTEQLAACPLWPASGFVRACRLAAILALLGGPSLSAGEEQAIRLAQVVDAATKYVMDYEAALSSIVAEERYEQRVTLTSVSAVGMGLVPRQETKVKHILSDYLLVKVDDVQGWVPFRDVYEVDGTLVRERDDRLMKLFVDSPDTALEQARRVIAESARYNLGRLARDVNVPTLALTFLAADRRSRFEFSLGGGQTISGVKVVRLGFLEKARPTLLSGGPDGDVVASGAMWVDPASGRVVRTELSLKSPMVKAQIAVDYQDEPKAGLWVPVRMKERYESARETIEGTADYGNFRRFQVEVSPSIE